MPSGEAETPRPQGSEKARRKLSNPARIESPAERAELFEDPGFTPKARPTPAAAPISTAPTEQNVATCSQEGDDDISAEVGAVEMLDNVLGPQADLSPETAAQKPPTQEGSPPPVSARRVLSLYGEWERDEYVVLNDNQRRAAFLRGGAVPVVGLTQTLAVQHAHRAKAKRGPKRGAKANARSKMPVLDFSQLTALYRTGDQHVPGAAMRNLDAASLSARLPQIMRPLSRGVPERRVPLTERPRPPPDMTRGSGSDGPAGGGSG